MTRIETPGRRPAGRQIARSPTSVHSFSRDDDAELLESAVRALHGRGYPALWDLDVEVSEGIVVIEGFVSSYYLKQVVQATVQAVDGVRTVENLLEVR